MNIIVRNVNNTSILDLSGSLMRGQPVDAFRNQVQDLLKGGAKHLAINLTQVQFIDSSGVGALVGAFTSVGAVGAKCKFYGATERVFQILKMLRLDRALDLHPDEASALSAF
jgi:anti-sigma B factor antagonist